jgi:hypothetical protein
LSDKSACNAIEETIAYCKSAAMEYIIQSIKDEVAGLYLDMCNSYETPGRPLHKLYDYYYVSTTSVSPLALYVQNTSLLLLP